MKSTTHKFSSSFILSFLILLGAYNSAEAQFWTEDFTPTNFQPLGAAIGYVGDNPGAWTVTSLPGNTGGANSNIWYVSCSEASMQPNNHIDERASKQASKQTIAQTAKEQSMSNQQTNKQQTRTRRVSQTSNRNTRKQANSQANKQTHTHTDTSTPNEQAHSL